MGYWQDPYGGLLLNLLGSVLWDGAKRFGRAALGLRTDPVLRQIEAALAERAAVDVDAATLRRWFADEDFWQLLVASDTDEVAHRATVTAVRERYCPGLAEERVGQLVSVLLIEVARRDDDLRARLDRALAREAVDVVVHSLGYVLEEVLGATFDVGRKVDEVAAQIADLAEGPPRRGRFADHGDVIGGLEGFRSWLTRLPFVDPGPEHPSNPAQLLARLAERPAVLLVGAGGTGKTRVLLEVAQLAQAAGWRTLHAPVDTGVTLDDLRAEAGDTGDTEQTGQTGQTGQTEQTSRGPAPTLFVVDYLNELSGMDLLALPHHLAELEVATGAHVAVVAAARPGWMRTSDGVDAAAAFDIVDVRADQEHQGRILDEIVGHVAPTASAAMEPGELRRVCGKRPIIALLVARELERRAAAGRLGGMGAVRDGDLLYWLVRRLRDDGLEPEPTARPVADVAADPALVAAAAVLAACPQAIDGLRAVAARARGLAVPDEIAHQQVEDLLDLGWIEDRGTSYGAVHDVVVDQVVEQVVFTPGVRTLRTPNAFAFLDAMLTRPRTLGQATGNLDRLIADLRLRVSVPDRVVQQLGDWFAGRVDDLAALMADGTLETALALRALLGSQLWSADLVRHWSRLVEPWLGSFAGEQFARPLIYAALRNTEVGAAAPAGPGLVEATFRWLDVNGTTWAADRVLGELLRRDDVDPDRLTAHVVAWLDRRGMAPHTSLFLTTALGCPHLVGAPDLDRATFAWLDRHGTSEIADYVLRALILRPTVADAADVERRAFAWLSVHGQATTADFLLTALVGWPRLVDADRARRAALRWLARNTSSHEASHLLNAVISRTDLPVDHELEEVARAWLGHNGTEPIASYVLGPLLKRDDAGPPAWLESRALAWLDANLVPEPDLTSHVLAPLIGHKALADRDRADRCARAWLDDHGTEPIASYVLGPLLKRDDAGPPAWLESRALAWLDANLDGAPDLTSHVLAPLIGHKALADRHRAEGCARAWLDGHGTDAEAVFVISALLAVDTGRLGPTVEQAAHTWLRARGDSANASYILQRLLQRRDLDDPATARELALAWLAHHGTGFEATYVLGGLVESQRDPPLQDLDRAVVAWLGPNGTAFEATFVLRWLLERPRLGDGDGNGNGDGDAPSAESFATAWLDVHGRTPEARFVLQRLLQRRDLEDPAAAERLTRTWLARHGSAASARFVLAPLLRLRPLGDPEGAVRAAKAWLADHPTGDTSYVIRALRSRGENP